MIKYLLPFLMAAFGWTTLARGQESKPAAPQRLWQPVQEYFTIVTPTGTGIQARSHTVNPFLSYTHLGTDFGFVGPAESGIGWAPGMVWAQLPNNPDGWAGMWHSLARLARMPEETLDFEKPYAPWIEARFQPRIVGVRAHVLGKGDLKLEIKGADQQTLWSKKFRIDADKALALSEPLDPATLRGAKLLNWIAEPGADLLIDSLGFEMEEPPMAFDEWVWAASYAKISRCYSPATGLVRDRAHTEDGAFDSIPATGLFLLATSAAAQTGLVSPDFARQALRQSWATVSSLKGPHGLLPHFARRVEGGFDIHPGTEYSTVDTAIYLHGALLAAQVLGEGGLVEMIADAMKAVEFAPLRNDDGYVTHGMKDDGVTRLPYIWRDWGGETALVLLLQEISSGGTLEAKMAANGRVHQGTGFIGEIQSLFYPDFGQARPDAVSQVNWLGSRQQLLAEQKAYFQRTQTPEGFARRHGLYGLSAGEGAYGIGYHVGGSDLPNQSLLHPHYILMSSAMENSPQQSYALLRRMRELDLFPPWGLVENIFADGTEHLPLQAGLNASFEAVSAYHLFARSRGQTDAIYAAAESQRDVRLAMQAFYPAPDEPPVHPQ